MQILALPLISIIFKNKLGSFGTDCRWQTLIYLLLGIYNYFKLSTFKI